MQHDDNSTMSKYLSEIGRQPTLSQEEEQRLSKRIAEGDGQAIDRLATANLRLVVAQAAKYVGRGLDFDDLVSEGNLGLLKAAAKYDAAHGRFSSYATPLIRHQIEQALAPNAPAEPLPSANGETTGTSRPRRPMSVDAPLGGRDNVNLLSLLENPDAPAADKLLTDGMERELLQRALATLNERERSVTEAYFGIGGNRKTMAEIAEDMGLKRERVRQVRDTATRKLRKALRNGTKE